MMAGEFALIERSMRGLCVPGDKFLLLSVGEGKRTRYGFTNTAPSWYSCVVSQMSNTALHITLT